MLKMNDQSQLECRLGMWLVLVAMLRLDGQMNQLFVRSE